MAEDDTFLSRWSRRKVQARHGTPAPAAVVPLVVPQALTVGEAKGSEGPAPGAPEAGAAPTAGSASTQAAAGSAAGHAAAVARSVPSAPAPTLDDVAALSKDSDYTRFVATDVDPEVKNAAMKKLFASDPHFNQMDGLDVYIDDYNRFEPIPRNLLRQLVNARAMGLLDDELPEQPAPHNPSPPHEDADLQLQPHDAAGQPGPEPGVAGSADRPDGTAPDPVPPGSP
jgi:hypothetical protein